MRRTRAGGLFALLSVGVGCAAGAGAPGSGGGGGGPTGSAVAGLAITEIAVFQGPKVDLVSGGKHVAHKTPIVAGRAGILRVYVQPSSDWTAIPITATLTISGSAGNKTVSVDATPTAASTEAQLASTIDFDLPTDVLVPGASFGVTLTTMATQTPTDTSQSSWPLPGAPANADGTPALDALDVQSSGGQVKVKIVPVKYMADGSGRLPDTSAAQLALYQQQFMKWYPVANVEISVRDPWAYNGTIAANGIGWPEALMAAQQLRQTDGAPADVYYYAALAPGASLDSWCASGCVAGLSGLDSSPTDTFQRSSIGLGWTGTDSTETAAHEVGHAHGRAHSPCGGAAMPDPSYPYTKGAIGVWGYDVLAKKLVDPRSGKIDLANGDPFVIDFMGYSTDPANQTVWSSDYTYQELFTRIATVNGAMSIRGARPTTLRVLIVDRDGVRLGGTLRADDVLEGADRVVEWTGPAGEHETAQGRFVPFDHLEGGFLYAPEPSFSPIRATFAHPNTGALAVARP